MAATEGPVLAFRLEPEAKMLENKTKATILSVGAFIDALTDPARRSDARELVELMQRASGEKPRLWGPSIIGFGSYHYRYDSGREGDMPLVLLNLLAGEFRSAPRSHRKGGHNWRSKVSSTGGR